jgi:hypothetical protein
MMARKQIYNHLLSGKQGKIGGEYDFLFSACTGEGKKSLVKHSFTVQRRRHLVVHGLTHDTLHLYART